MIEALQTLQYDFRSQLILGMVAVCWLFAWQKPSKHAVGGAVAFVAAFLLFAMWKYAPSYTPIGEPDIATMNIEQLRAYILERREAEDVLWRQMEMYVTGIHATEAIVLLWALLLHIYPPHVRDLVAKFMPTIWLASEGLSLALDNTWCRFVVETKGSDLIDYLMYTGDTPTSCEIHYGPISDWWIVLAALLPFLYVVWMHSRAKERMG